MGSFDWPAVSPGESQIQLVTGNRNPEVELQLNGKCIHTKLNSKFEQQITEKENSKLPVIARTAQRLAQARRARALETPLMVRSQSSGSKNLPDDLFKVYAFNAMEGLIWNRQNDMLISRDHSIISNDAKELHKLNLLPGLSPVKRFPFRNSISLPAL